MLLGFAVPPFQTPCRAVRAQLANGAEPGASRGYGDRCPSTQRAQRLFLKTPDDPDDTSANSTLADTSIDIEDDMGIESFEDGENYELENDGDDETDD